MPGKVIAVLVAEGDQVEKGQGLVIVEAMKMENEVHSPIAGEVKEIKVKAGDTVEGGAVWSSSNNFRAGKKFCRKILVSLIHSCYSSAP